MDFVHVTFKTGQVIKGILVSQYTPANQIVMLVFEDDNYRPATIATTIIARVEPVRKLTEEELNLVQKVMGLTLRMEQHEQVIHQYQLQLEQLKTSRQYTLNELTALNVNVKPEKDRPLKFSEIEEFLTPDGYKNLYLLQRDGVFSISDFDELIFAKNQLPVNAKDKEVVINVLNRPKLLTEGVNLDELAKGNLNHTTDVTNDNRKENVQNQTNGTLNLNNFKDKLTPEGFENLRGLEKSELIKVESDGTIRIVGDDIPFIQEWLTNEDTLVNILNHPTSLPLPLNLVEAIIPGLLKFLK
ncbi:hypothetical protein PP175_28815 (plasmid) [Aneurinibacillus sp. Ricciae_BoGa-3]|uniref:hypothetical protein n=1 Tax=Aneurinibacillus sp. Ricciae_BoGa-3 TaxID=3022697 RepID=UPI00234014DE|nr:hypothetical protein [Aneurinibacillus sp. Ricciae_BoGa-3]WCK57193.1 hypothetical protein PP175_28815 [Aneurinibacillus sp. Ricciae_BoGa-3]